MRTIWKSRWLIAALASLGIAQAAREIVLHDFAFLPSGGNPQSGVIRDSQGNFYGTVSAGGPSNAGAIYKVDAAGHETVLYTFSGGADGASPYAGVIADAQGNLFGTTVKGGASDQGVVYKLDRAGHETVLYSFTGGTDGAQPYAGVIRDDQGNLYGTTYSGGIGSCNGCGVVYKLDAAGHETVLHSFALGDAQNPYAGVIRDEQGNLYGTTAHGGSSSDGAVYKLEPGGNEVVLYSFEGRGDGGNPSSGVIRDGAGNLYGTTSFGGAANAGVVYKLDSAGHETVLYSFTGGANGNPAGGLVRDRAGNLYGTASGGSADFGIVYKLDSSGHETVLYTFAGGANGSGPNGVILDTVGSVYGTTAFGGTRECASVGCGVLFRVDAAGQETAVYTFGSTSDGFNPCCRLIRDEAGNFYGTANYGGPAGAGVVYKLDPAGHETVLYSFTGGADGGDPSSGVVRDGAGNLYGTTTFGGSANYGVVYEIDATGHETVLHNFTSGADGAYPSPGVVRDAAGNLYGTTFAGGPADAGVVYKVDAGGDETVMYSFTFGSDGGYPEAGVVVDAEGNLYGTTLYGGAGCNAGCGVVYKVDSAGHETVLYTFTGGEDGANPMAGVIRSSSGALYGTTYSGGYAENACGTVYRVDATGHETTLYGFTCGANGGQPVAGVIRDAVGNLYGATSAGGGGNCSGGCGVIYKLDTAGHETVLYSFTGGADGALPQAGLIGGASGELFGTTNGGGKGAGGVVFAIKAAAP